MWGFGLVSIKLGVTCTRSGSVYVACSVPNDVKIWNYMPYCLELYAFSLELCNYMPVVSSLNL